MGKIIDLTGKRFGRLTVIERVENDNQKKPQWRCKCDCGNETIARANALRRGTIVSCGCYSKEIHRTHGGCGSRLYAVWKDMKGRCFNPNHRFYSDYGGRGITVCEQWLTFEIFQRWAISAGYDPNAEKWTCTLDRINNSIGYCPENCRWADMKTQGRNKRNNRMIEYHGQCKSLSEWVNELGLSYQTVYARLTRYRLSVEEAFERK